MAKDFFKMLPQILYRQPLHGKRGKNDLLGCFTKQAQTQMQQLEGMNKTTVFICKIGITILKRTREVPVDKERDV